MNAIAIQYIWQAIQESERSDDLPFIDALTRRMPPARSDALSRESITAVVADPLPTNSDPLPTVTWPPV
jgi:hypothetical protein